ncbi:hypothetical protein SeLEV6574_g02579 [Synchytrium endobioticum]|uniref:Uncharacterized protein n=1 Tax=Synchytrium endobioticum TaxID=286115 RepID=A0A507D9W1_9FUNG|nr:hypothetical protein SeLEV6574_g02579 [Synchytrium endobioticum]
MGIKYFWKYLTSLNVVKEKLGSVDSKQLFGVTGNGAPKGVPGGLKGVDGEGRQGRIYVDILGCFYTEIIRCVELGHPSRPYNFAPLMPPPDRKVEDSVNLPNIFHNKTLQSIHKKAWIIGLDPGATCIAGAVAFHPSHPDQRRNLAVTTKCLAEPERRHRDWPFAQPNGSAPSPTRRLGRLPRTHVRSYDIARAYYSTKKYKRKRWDADKAKRGELDRVLEGIVNMVGASMGYKLSGGKKVIVAIGMGDFSSTKSRHVMFIRGYLEHDERPADLKPPSRTEQEQPHEAEGG